MNPGRGLALVISLAFGASLALADPPPQAEKKPAPPCEEAGAPAAGAGKGLVVFVDPATGKIRQPDAAEIGGLVAPPAAADAGAPLAEKPLVMKFGPGRAVGIVLDERFETFMVVTKAPGGKLAMDCVEGRKKADAAVAAPAAGGKTDAR